MKHLLCITVCLLAATLAGAQTLSGTYRFAQRDTCDLYLDIYEPAAVDGPERPSVLFVFGGGFITGRRNDPYCLPWFKQLTDNGFRVISVDYRLGLKGVRMRFDPLHLIDAADKTKHAVDVGVEDVFAAVRYLTDHAEELGVDMSGIVLAGSSAGAMISLSCEWEICNGTPRTAVLPLGFNFAGVMSFAGAIMSDSGEPAYPLSPCPQLLIHGTADGAVAYDKTAFGRRGMYGSNALAKILDKGGFVYNIYRFKDHSHDMAANFIATWPEQIRFLEENVMGRSGRIIDAMVDDPAVPVMGDITLDDIY